MRRSILVAFWAEARTQATGLFENLNCSARLWRGAMSAKHSHPSPRLGLGQLFSSASLFYLIARFLSAVDLLRTSELNRLCCSVALRNVYWRPLVRQLFVFKEPFANPFVHLRNDASDSDSAAFCAEVRGRLLADGVVDVEHKMACMNRTELHAHLQKFLDSEFNRICREFDAAGDERPVRIRLATSGSIPSSNTEQRSEITDSKEERFWFRRYKALWTWNTTGVWRCVGSCIPIASRAHEVERYAYNLIFDAEPRNPQNDSYVFSTAVETEEFLEFGLHSLPSQSICQGALLTFRQRAFNSKHFNYCVAVLCSTEWDGEDEFEMSSAEPAPSTTGPTIRGLFLGGTDSRIEYEGQFRLVWQHAFDFDDLSNSDSSNDGSDSSRGM